MEFHDFQIRAWTIDKEQAEVLVHSSPAGAMLRPNKVFVDWERLNAFQKIFQPNSQPKPENGTAAPLIDGGQALASVVFSDPVVSLLIMSLERIDPENGLRVRLCLDSALSDLPWEYLILPPVTGPKSFGGFLALDPRISLVREPPQPGHQRPRLQKKQRLLYFGTRQIDINGKDIWKAAVERDKLFKALEPADTFLEKQAVLSNEADCRTALMRSRVPIDIFHYSGHTDTENGNGYLVANDVELKGKSFDRLYANALCHLLRRARTTIAVFSACNSGSLAFVEPLLQAGVPVVVGAQGIVYVDVAITFCQGLYSALAIGLSLDEAVTWARLHLLEPGVLIEPLKWQWGAFMVYMRTPETVLFPKPKQATILEQQKTIRSKRQQAIINIEKLVYQDIDQQIGKVMSGQVTGSSIGQIRDR